MGPRYPAGPRPGVRMPQMGNEFNGVSSLFRHRNLANKLKTKKLKKNKIKTVGNNCAEIIHVYTHNFFDLFQPPGQPMMPNSMDPTRQGEAMRLLAIFKTKVIDVFILFIFSVLASVSKGEWLRRMSIKNHTAKEIIKWTSNIHLYLWGIWGQSKTIIFRFTNVILKIIKRKISIFHNIPKLQKFSWFLAMKLFTGISQNK